MLQDKPSPRLKLSYKLALTHCGPKQLDFTALSRLLGSSAIPTFNGGLPELVWRCNTWKTKSKHGGFWALLWYVCMYICICNHGWLLAKSLVLTKLWIIWQVCAHLQMGVCSLSFSGAAPAGKTKSKQGHCWALSGAYTQPWGFAAPIHLFLLQVHFLAGWYPPANGHGLH